MGGWRSVAGLLATAVAGPGRRCAAVVLGLWAVSTLPFLTKAFHIDDTAYLAIARQIIADPWRPYSFDFHWGWKAQPAFTLYHPPLLPAYLAGLITLDGGRVREAPLHLGVSLFAALMAFAVYRLARRFGGPPGLSAALVVLSPIVLPGTNLMLDMPMLALFLLALHLHVTGVDRGSRTHLAAAGIVAGLAILTKYNAVLLLPLMACYSWLRRDGRSLTVLIIPGAMVGLWCWHNMEVYGRLHLTAQVGPPDMSLRRLGSYAFSTLLVAGAAGCWVPLTLTRRWSAWALAGASVGGTVSLSRMLCGVRDPWETAVFLANGLLLALTALWAAGVGLVRLTRGELRADEAFRDRLFLAAWILGVVMFAWRFIPIQAVRHYLLALPPVVLLLLRGASPVRAALTVALTAAVALAVAVADADLANGYRNAARRIMAEKPAAARTVWFVGSWGWQYYAEMAGMRRLPDRSETIAPGDILAAPRGAHREPVTPSVARRFRPWREFPLERTIPIRTQAEGSGFYSMLYGDVPYSAVRRTPIDVIDLSVATR